MQYPTDARGVGGPGMGRRHEDDAIGWRCDQVRTPPPRVDLSLWMMEGKTENTMRLGLGLLRTRYRRCWVCMPALQGPVGISSYKVQPFSPTLFCSSTSLSLLSCFHYLVLVVSPPSGRLIARDDDRGRTEDVSSHTLEFGADPPQIRSQAFA
jgi:hypothetical protein